MTRIAVFRARALIMEARPHPPSTAIAILVGLDRVARRVSLIKSQFGTFSRSHSDWSNFLVL